MIPADPQPTTLDRETIVAGARKALAGMLDTDPDALTEDTRLFADLGLDSTDTLELLMLIEDDLGAEIDTDTLEHRHLETVGTLADYFAEQAGA